MSIYPGNNGFANMLSFDRLATMSRNLLDRSRAAMNPEFRSENYRAKLMHRYNDPQFVDIYDRCHRFTMTGVERMYSLYEATRYVARNRIPGDIVECGVWKGGSIMLVCLTLISLGQHERQIFLYDTFKGMAKPTNKDRRTGSEDSLIEEWSRLQVDDHTDWAYCDIEEVKRNVLSTGYEPAKLSFVKGKVEDTIPQTIPERISLLRLDTDLYESTKHELSHLLPRLVFGGVLAIDDYGDFEGCRKAVDEYFEDNSICMLLNKVDDSGYRIGVKTVAD